MVQVQSPSITKRLAIFVAMWIAVTAVGFACYLMAYNINGFIDASAAGNPWEPSWEWGEFTTQPAGIFTGLPLGFIIGILLSNLLLNKFFHYRGLLLWGIVAVVVGEAIAWVIGLLILSPVRLLEWLTWLLVPSFLGALVFNLRAEDTRTFTLAKGSEVLQTQSPSRIKRLAVFVGMWIVTGHVAFGGIILVFLIAGFICHLRVLSSYNPLAGEWSGMAVAIIGLLTGHPIGLIGGILLSTFLLNRIFHYRGLLLWSIVACIITDVIFRMWLVSWDSGMWLPLLFFTVPPLFGALVFNLRAREAPKELT